MTRTGTCNFVSLAAAERYYASYYGAGTSAAVYVKLKEKTIEIGPPKVKPSQKLEVNDEGRYVIVDKN